MPRHAGVNPNDPNISHKPVEMRISHVDGAPPPTVEEYLELIQLMGNTLRESFSNFFDDAEKNKALIRAINKAQDYLTNEVKTQGASFTLETYGNLATAQAKVLNRLIKLITLFYNDRVLNATTVQVQQAEEKIKECSAIFGLPVAEALNHIVFLPGPKNSPLEAAPTCAYIDLKGLLPQKEAELKASSGLGQIFTYFSKRDYEKNNLIRLSTNDAERVNELLGCGAFSRNRHPSANDLKVKLEDVKKNLADNKSTLNESAGYSSYGNEFNKVGLQDNSAPSAKVK